MCLSIVISSTKSIGGLYSYKVTPNHGATDTRKYLGGVMHLSIFCPTSMNTGKGRGYVGIWTFKNCNPHYLGSFSLSNPLFSPTIPQWMTAGIARDLVDGTRDNQLASYKAETSNIVPEFQHIKGLPDNYLHQNTQLPGGRLAVDFSTNPPPLLVFIHSSGEKHW